MTSPEFLSLAVIACYLAGTLSVLSGFISANAGLKRFASHLALAAFALHTVDLGSVLVDQGKMALLTSGFYFSFLAWTLLAIYLLVWWRFKSGFLALTALPLALILFLASLAVGGLKVTIPPSLTGLFFSLHIASLAVSLALMALAFGAGVAFVRTNRKLKTKTALANMDNDLPSLDIFDRINRWAVLVGFLLFTLGLCASFAWYWVDPEKVFHVNIMNLSSLGVWVMFAALFYQRLALGWKGRKPAVFAIVVFVSMVITLLHHTITFERLQ